MKIAVNIKSKDGPWGGGSAFIDCFENYFKKKGVIIKHDLEDDDIDIILILDPRFRHPLKTFSIGAIFRYLKFKNPKAIVVHRINECDERKNTNFMNKLLKICNYLADHTVFVGSWLKKLDLWEKKSSSVILNGSNKSLFYPRVVKKLLPYGLVSHHWSDNYMKGFDIYKKIDLLLNKTYWKNKISFTYIGRLPKNFKFINTRVLEPLFKENLAKEISRHHIYVTGSINEPGGNHQNEGALSGLPLLYRGSGCFPEYCKGYGVEFTYDNFEKSLKKIIKRYKFYKEKIKHYPHTSNRCMKQYEKLFKNLISKKNKVLQDRSKTNNFFKDINFFFRP
jgi:hypothetical protein